jgi:hypothetical protein
VRARAAPGECIPLTSWAASLSALHNVKNKIEAREIRTKSCMYHGKSLTSRASTMASLSMSVFAHLNTVVATVN